VSGVADPAFQRQERLVRTVDVLPVDIQVWTFRGARHDPEAVANGLDAMVTTMVQQELAVRGYDTVAAFDWEGMFDGPQGPAQAMDPQALAVTALALSSYGVAQAKVSKRGEILVPHVPVALGTETGSDATLYVGGWAYSGKKKKGMSTGAKVAVGVLVGVLIVGVIVLAVAGGKGGGGGGGGIGKGLGKAASGVGKAAARAGSGLSRAAGGFGRLVGATARGVMRAGVTIGRHGPRIALETLDAFGRAGFDTHIYVQPTRVDYYEQKSTPRKGPSAMLLEMTLVDNRTGKTLWHARRRFPASPRSGKHVHKAVNRLMATLPTATGGAPGSF
jgi:hypothetical protein